MGYYTTESASKVNEEASLLFLSYYPSMIYLVAYMYIWVVWFHCASIIITLQICSC